MQRGRRRVLEDEAEPAVYVCNGCGLAISRQSLMDSNQERLSEAVKELKNEVVSDISKDLKAVIKGLKVK